MEKEIMKVVNKKIRKGIVLMIVLGIVFGGIAGVTAYTISAKEIGYSPKDSSWKVTNVADAIESLKTLKGGSNNYSLDEQVVGTWIDGKPLYQKTVNFNMPSSSNPAEVVDLSALNIDHWEFVSGTVTTSNGAKYSLTYIYDSSEYIGFWVRSNKYLTVRATHSDFYNMSGVITFKYTKTTDNATNS